MLQFNKVENSSYRLIKNDHVPHVGSKNIKNLNHISECSDSNCVYFRPKFNTRDRFEKKIYQQTVGKTNIKILFYGSFLLYQELNILFLLGDKISELHFTDYAYKQILEENNETNKYLLAFNEFTDLVHKINPHSRIYVHTNPDELIASTMFQRRFDIICGIDIDYTQNNTNNRPIMKQIANTTLKIDGIMIMSQHNLDQVDLCHYEIMENGIIKLIYTEDFVKNPYYNLYKTKYMLGYLYYPLNLFGLAGSMINLKKFPIASITAGTYFALNILYRFSIGNNNNYQKTISEFTSLFK